MAYRQRHKTVRDEPPPAPLPETPTDGTETTENVTEERTPKERGRRKRSTANRDGQTNRNAAPRKARIAFVEQLRKQQPENAAGYRLVLPARSPADTPKIVPAPDSQGGIRYWRLSPFEIPDDIRLQDGLSYRVVWVDAAGQPIAATTPYVPELDFFLGPPDSERDERNAAYEAIFRDVRDPVLRRNIEADVARSRLALQRERERAEILARQTERRERHVKLETQQMEAYRRWQREDRAEAERQDERRKSELENIRAAQEALKDREMWTAFKVMGGTVVAAALAWGPFTKWLDSLPSDKSVETSKQNLTAAVFHALGTLTNGIPQLRQEARSEQEPSSDGGSQREKTEPTPIAEPVRTDPGPSSSAAGVESQQSAAQPTDPRTVPPATPEPNTQNHRE